MLPHSFHRRNDVARTARAGSSQLPVDSCVGRSFGQLEVHTAAVQPPRLLRLENQELQRTRRSDRPNPSKSKTTYLVVVSVPKGKRRLAVVFRCDANAKERPGALA